MKNPTLPIALLLLLGCSLPAWGQTPMEGEWTIARGTMSGKSVPTDILSKMKLKISGQSFDATSGDISSKGTVTEQGRQGRLMQVVFKINSGDDAGREIKATYQMVGANLKIIYSQTGEFPTDTRSTVDNNLLVLTYNKTAGGRTAAQRPNNSRTPNFTLGEPTFRGN